MNGAPQQWEYRIVHDEDVKQTDLFGRPKRAAVEALLNQLGAEGWELVNIDFSDDGPKFFFTGVLKRPRQNSQ